VVAERDDEREADDRAVDDPGDLAGAEVGLETGAHAKSASSRAGGIRLIRWG
jgi:hypothetical protein